MPPIPPKFRKCLKGFTLAELLICVALIGVISAIAIPKILTAQQNAETIAVTKEVFAMVSGAYTQYAASNTASASTTEMDLTPFMNYVKVVSGNQIDQNPGFSGGITCGSAGAHCLRIHNGSILMYFDYFSFGGTSNLNALGFIYDPDGVYTGLDDSIKFYLYFNGRISTRERMAPNTSSSINTLNPYAGADPAWYIP